jgi:DNA-binding transcriptional LysR family regulator
VSVAEARSSFESELKHFVLVIVRGDVRMEMHQVRYFLAVARTLNFTRAAEECHVAQPSLTRAIKLLEGELGGDLFRRERPRTMLTPLGERMFPLLKECYDSAQSARALAAMINDGEIGALKLAVSSSIELGLILSHVNELRKSFSEIELKILRGTGPQIVEYLKAGDAELAVGTSIAEAWDRVLASESPALQTLVQRLHLWAFR